MLILRCTISRKTATRRLLTSIGLPLTLCALQAVAETRETLSYVDYQVEANSRQSLATLLTRTSPIRHRGKIFHAYTTWRVSWEFRWQQDADGNCRVSQVSTGLDSVIQLPRLDGGSPEQQERFQHYLSALREHELGHHNLGRQAAQEVDARLRSMPSMPDCTRLAAAGNRLAQHIVEDYKDKEHTYDLVTVHGRMQGARLDH